MLLAILELPIPNIHNIVSASAVSTLSWDKDAGMSYIVRNEKELPGLRNGRLRREGTSWTSKWTLETRRNAS
ncbi:unnamed protein product [Rhizophagus irregularis]|nr:unnamed protein product [Rhizophagus irregularis]